MKKPMKITMVLGLLCLLHTAKAGGNDDHMKFQREVPILNTEGVAQDDSSTTIAVVEVFKPSVHVGSIVHMFASSQQSGFGSPSVTGGDDWQQGFTLYRARVLVGGQLSKNGAFFLETDLPSPVGVRNADGSKNVKVAPIILDAQYEHQLGKGQMVIVGKQLIAHNRNGLQGAAALMANDFTYFQYPYNLFENSPLQGNFGRDLGVNFRGFLASDKLEYRIGAFTGRTWEEGFTPRITGRVVYNFLDPEKDFYYAGTKLGNGETVALGGGVDVQGQYFNAGVDLFVDVPVGESGAVTLNSAFNYMTGGTDTAADYSFAMMIPTQTIQYLELGYYFKEAKLQPWIRFERQGMNADPTQTGGMDVDIFNDTQSTVVFGGGLNYWFNDYGTNLRLSYTTWNGQAYDAAEDETVSRSYGQLWMQLQFFIF